MDGKAQEQIALHRWAVIAEAAGARLTAAERGALVRQIAARDHQHPDGSRRRYSRGTVDRWLRAWRRGGLEALRPSPRADTGVVRAHPELFAEAAALRLELPGRSAAKIASILYHRYGVAVSERTVRGQLRRAGLHRAALAAEPKACGRYEAARPNERWITDVLIGPWVPWPRRDGSVRARLFLIVDDHSRLLVDGRFYGRENARACQELLRRAITRRGLPQVFYADNGAPFANAGPARGRGPPTAWTRRWPGAGSSCDTTPETWPGSASGWTARPPAARARSSPAATCTGPCPRPPVPSRTPPASTTSAWSPPPTTRRPAPARRSTSPPSASSPAAGMARSRRRSGEPGTVGRALRPDPHPVRQVHRGPGPVRPPGPRRGDRPDQLLRGGTGAGSTHRRRRGRQDGRPARRRLDAGPHPAPGDLHRQPVVRADDHE